MVVTFVLAVSVKWTSALQQGSPEDPLWYRRCLVDKKPQKFDTERAAILCNLAELIVRELESAWAVQYQRRCPTPGVPFCLLSAVGPLTILRAFSG